ncbi:hypothetical protein BAE29_06125 [Acidithiobacillus caldus]|nr:hypothetical protein BAE28_05505 [Acidithiobacillus caldus]OFC39997.1 hypothetical protein BAE29_06125 [Acidithiobacillus caldus]
MVTADSASELFWYTVLLKVLSTGTTPSALAVELAVPERVCPAYPAESVSGPTEATVCAELPATVSVTISVLTPPPVTRAAFAMPDARQDRAAASATANVLFDFATFGFGWDMRDLRRSQPV